MTFITDQVRSRHVYFICFLSFLVPGSSSNAVIKEINKRRSSSDYNYIVGLRPACHT